MLFLLNRELSLNTLEVVSISWKFLKWILVTQLGSQARDWWNFFSKISWPLRSFSYHCSVTLIIYQIVWILLKLHNVIFRFSSSTWNSINTSAVWFVTQLSEEIWGEIDERFRLSQQNLQLFLSEKIQSCSFNLDLHVLKSRDVHLLKPLDFDLKNTYMKE